MMKAGILIKAWKRYRKERNGVQDNVRNISPLIIQYPTWVREEIYITVATAWVVSRASAISTEDECIFNEAELIVAQIFKIFPTLHWTRSSSSTRSQPELKEHIPSHLCFEKFDAFTAAALHGVTLLAGHWWWRRGSAFLRNVSKLLPDNTVKPSRR
jgi:hypothetical protein